MKERLFRFKQFSVRHDRSAMKVGTDGVLVGAWCSVAGTRRVLDVGTGCGVIALMIAQREPHATITAIDIHRPSMEEAAENFAASPWAHRLRAVETDFTEYASLSNDQFDLIVSNPPFFVEEVLPPDAHRSDARHTNSLSFEELFDGVSRLLTPVGRFTMVAPVESEAEIEAAAEQHKLHIARKTTVVTIANQLPRRILWEFSPTITSPALNQLIIEKSTHEYTQEYKSLCQDFYLKF